MSGLQITSAASVADGAQEVADELAAILKSKNPDPVSFLTVFATEALAHDGLAERLAQRFPHTPIFGGTSCRGVVTEAGAHVGAPHAAGVLAIHDPAGNYATASAAIGDDPRTAAAAALELALERADRPHEAPAQIWTCQPPGVEEQVLSGYADVVGANCPIIGGSSADETIAGGWRQFSSNGTLTNHVVVGVLFPSAPLGLAFKSGYAPTEHTGVVTRCTSRRLVAIDGRPAAEKYAQWTNNAINPATPGMILQQSTPHPLARRVGSYAGVDEYLLSHPASIEDDGALTLFAEVAEGDVLRLMAGTRESLIERAGRVIGDAQGLLPSPSTAVAGGLVIYCGGCMLAVADDLDAVAANMKEAFRDAPFLAAFTFGEQGALVSSGNRHGNLMIAASVASNV